MNLKREFEKIEAFFHSISEEDFEKMLDECGNTRIKSTGEIASIQGVELYDCRSFYENTMNGEFLAGYDVYNDGKYRNEAA